MGDVIDLNGADDDGFIDLGERRGEVASESLPAGPAQWRRVTWRAHKKPISIAIVVLVALLVGGAVAPLPPRLPRIGSITVPLGAALAVDGTRVVVLGSRDGVGESIAAYTVAGGRRDWFTELSIRQADDVNMTVTDGLIIVSGGRLGDRGPHTAVVDEKTGNLLWSSRLDVLSPRRGSDALLASGGPTSVISLDKRTGKPKWFLSLAAGCSADLAVPADPEAPTALVELCLYDAMLSRVNLNTGDSELVHDVPLKASRDVDITMFTVDDVVVVEDAGIKPPLFNAYRLGNLKPLWTTRGFSNNDGSYPCGIEVCVSANGVTVILDAHSGSLIPTVGRESEAAVTVLQPFVPKSVVGTLLLPAPGATVPVVNRATYVANFAADDAVVHVPLFRAGRTRVVTLSAAGIRDAVQLLDGPSADVCRPIGSYLGCMTAKQTMTFWTLPTIR